jgi:hypothetical protein
MREMRTYIGCDFEEIRVIFDILETEDHVGSIRCNVVVKAESSDVQIQAISINKWIDYVSFDEFTKNLKEAGVALLVDMSEFQILRIEKNDKLCVITLNPKSERMSSEGDDVFLEVKTKADFINKLHEEILSFAKWW